MSEPKPIEPQDIRVGMRVRNEQNLSRDDTATWEFTVELIADTDRNFVSTSGRRYHFGPSSGTWTLLADAPEPDRPVGSHWRDPETGAEYVKTDGVGAYDFTRIRAGVDQTGVGRRFLRSTDAPDDQIIARLTPIPALDPAVLWPQKSRGENTCWASDENGNRLFCSRAYGHGGLHAAYINEPQPVAVWGDPR